jgi:hypothetical protein
MPSDDLLAALSQELRVALTTLNEVHHPVYPGSPERVAELEAQVEELRAAIAERKAALRQGVAAD